MAFYLAVGLFALTAMIVTMALADSAIRFRNAWEIARRELASTQADLSFELQRAESNVVSLRRPARKPLPRAAALSTAQRLQSTTGVVSAAA